MTRIPLVISDVDGTLVTSDKVLRPRRVRADQESSAPDDPRILNTIRVIDAMLKVEFPPGPCWRRYNGDGYGEHQD